RHRERTGLPHPDRSGPGVPVRRRIRPTFRLEERSKPRLAGSDDEATTVNALGFRILTMPIFSDPCGRCTMLGTAKFLTLEAAKKMAAAGEAAARQNGWNVALAIV